MVRVKGFACLATAQGRPPPLAAGVTNAGVTWFGLGLGLGLGLA